MLIIGSSLVMTDTLLTSSSITVPRLSSSKDELCRLPSYSRKRDWKRSGAGGITYVLMQTSFRWTAIGDEEYLLKSPVAGQ